MDALGVALVIAVPFAVLGGLLYALRRWGEKHDPMSERIDGHWHTTGTTRRIPEDDR